MAFFCLLFALPLRAFDWETATVNGRDYVTLRSFCAFYNFNYQSPEGNARFESRNAGHSVGMKVGSPDMYLDGVHYVMSFPVENGDHDWLVSRMDVIKLFEPILRPTAIADRHAIRGVVIDPGHGGSDNGATSRLGAEKNYTMDTAIRLARILEASGLKTVFTRRSDVFVDLYERAHIASLYPDYCFVSIHYNSASPEARGLETYCVSPRGAASTSSAYLTRGDIQKLPGNDADTQNILLASMVHSEIIKLNPGDSTADRGVKRARFVVIKQNVLPAILVEGGFVSNHMEAARVDRPEYRQSLAQAIAGGVIRFVNSMGDKNLAVPWLISEPRVPTPSRAIPVAPPAPAGFASDPANTETSTTPGTKPAPVLSSTTPGVGVPTSSHKKKKHGVTASSPLTPANQPGPASAPVLAPINPSNNATEVMAPSTVPSAQTPGVAPAPNPESPSQTPAASASTPGTAATSAPLNLSEPATPTPSPGADKASAEPDEPPPVNIYPTPPTKAAPETPAPSTQESRPTPSSTSSPTNAAPAQSPPIVP